MYQCILNNFKIDGIDVGQGQPKTHCLDDVQWKKQQLWTNNKETFTLWLLHDNMCIEDWSIELGMGLFIVVYALLISDSGEVRGVKQGRVGN